LKSQDISSRLIVDFEAISGFMQCGGTVERKKQDDNGAQGYHRHAEPKEASQWLSMAGFFVYGSQDQDKYRRDKEPHQAVT
jgi:hypothetical protein